MIKLSNICFVYPVQPVLDASVRTLCRRPYPGHPRGCPNWAKKDGCPPKVKLLNRYLDLAQPVFAVVHEFDIAGHVERMRAAHPTYSERQLRCCLYWQGRARSLWKVGIKEFLWTHPGYTAVPCPEAQGVNITETMRLAGVDLKWPPVKVSRQVPLCGVRL